MLSCKHNGHRTGRTETPSEDPPGNGKSVSNKRIGAPESPCPFTHAQFRSINKSGLLVVLVSPVRSTRANRCGALMPEPEPIDRPTAPGGRLKRACTNCTVGKAKCSPHSTNECERCHRLAKPCHYGPLATTRKRPRQTS